MDVSHSCIHALRLEVYTPADHPVSVYYPFALVDFVEALEDDENRAAGEILLVFRDQDGCHVTIRVRKEALEDLLAHFRGKV